MTATPPIPTTGIPTLAAVGRLLNQYVKLSKASGMAYYLSIGRALNMTEYVVKPVVGSVVEINEPAEAVWTRMCSGV